MFLAMNKTLLVFYVSRVIFKPIELMEIAVAKTRIAASGYRRFTRIFAVAILYFSIGRFARLPKHLIKFVYTQI